MRGVVSEAVHSVLDRHNILNQAQNGVNFIGNHCHSYLIRKVYMHMELTKEVILTGAKKTHKRLNISIFI